MNKFEKILLTIDIILFIFGAIAFCQGSKIGIQIAAYSVIAVFVVTAIFLVSIDINSNGNIFDNHTNINITINDPDKKI